jgi:cyclophilin family peptidyl-prolyl cis-trans isomerase
MIGSIAVVIALIVALVAVIISNHSSPSATSSTASTPIAMATADVNPNAIPTVTPGNVSPSASEVAASKQTCTPFMSAGQNPTGPRKWGLPPKQVIDVNKRWQVKLYTTKGPITAAIYTDSPITANNFIFLACQGFYDGLDFHRTVPGFMIQGGDPLGNGTGDPGYKFADETVKHPYQIGSLAMANSGPNTNGSQFFIIQGSEGVSLPPQYNLFGQVVAGENIVTAIATAPAHMSAGGGDSVPSAPNKPVVIKTITVQES